MSQLPSGWKMSRLDEVSEVINGGTPKTSIKEYWDGKHLWITPAEMGKRETPYIAESQRTLSDQGLQNSSATLVPPYSVIMSTRAPIGHLVINTNPMAFNQGCRGIVPKDGLEHKYLYYFLLNSVELLNELGTGATFKELSAGKLKSVLMPVPTVDEQQRIVTILDEAFAGIATATANAEKNLQNARELFESTLQSVFAEKGEGWEERRLGDSSLLIIVDGDRGVNYPKKDDFFPEGHCLFLNTKNVRPDGFDFEETMFITKEKDSALRKGKLKRNDVIMTTRGTLGNLAVYDDSVDYEHVRINSGMLIFRPNLEKLLPAYLFEVLRSGIIKSQIALHSSGAAQPQLPIKTLVNFTFPVPNTLKEQESIVNRLKEMSGKVKELEAIYNQKLNELAELKQSILQKAFAGELH